MLELDLVVSKFMVGIKIKVVNVFYNFILIIKVVLLNRLHLSFVLFTILFSDRKWFKGKWLTVSWCRSEKKQYWLTSRCPSNQE